jgi:hypothetical protein
MGAFDRFRKLERARPDRAGPPSTTDGVAERFGQPEMPSDPAEAAPLNCGKCGGDNPARSETCFSCGAELDTPEMRAHQDEYRVRHVAAQQKALAMREARRHEVEAKALHELERRRSAASQPGEPTWGQSNDAWPAQMPLVWLLRASAKVPDPWLRLGLQIAIVGGFVALAGYGLSSPNRYGLLVLVAILLGGGAGRRYRRWWW